MNDSLEHDGGSSARHERELTLGTGTILGIFFALVVLCGACFGVGYTMGHKSATPLPLTLNDPSADAPSPGGNSVSKPAAGSPMDNGLSSPTVTVMPPATAVPAAKPAPVVRKPPPVLSDEAETTPATSRSTSGLSSNPVAAPAKVPTARPVPPDALLPPATATAPVSAAPSGSIMVQVAAVSHREDADLLVSALRARGYTVAARPSSTDALIHVQVGPFSTKPAAEAMRQRLQNDGYNAMLKY